MSDDARTFEETGLYQMCSLWKTPSDLGNTKTSLTNDVLLKAHFCNNLVSPNAVCVNQAAGYRQSVSLTKV